MPEALNRCSINNVFSSLSSRDQKLIETLVRPSLQLSGISILLVENSLDSRDLVHRLLVRAGARVTDAQSPTDAREHLKNFSPDIIVSDIGMPGEDGLAFIRSLRNEGTKEQKTIPAIALTAFVRGQDKRAALAAGFQAHIAKPITMSVLLEAILQIIGGRR